MVLVSRWLISLTLLLTIGLLPKFALADEADAVIDRLLRDGWQVGPDGMATVRLEAAKAQTLRDSQALYAAGLALLRHHQYDDAAELFQAAIEADPHDFRSWRGLIWVRTLQEKFDAALVQIQRLSKQLPATELAPADEASVCETIQSLGRLFGFYEGPRTGDVSAVLVKRSRDAIQPALVGQRQVEFDNNYQDVATLFTSSTTKQQDARDEAKQKEEMAKLQAQQNIEIRRKQLEADMTQATDRIDKLRSDWKQEDERLTQMELPLSASISQLEAQQQVIRRELSTLVDDIFRLSSELEKTKDQARRDRLQREIVRLERLASDYERDLAVVQAEGRRLIANRDTLRTKRLQNKQTFEAEIEQMTDRKQDLLRFEKRLDLESNRNDRPATGSTAKVRVLKAKTSSIRTYYDFPLEVERLTLLGR